MKQIVIFSTKYIDEDNCLFSGDYKVSYTTNKISQYLFDFFNVETPKDSAIESLKNEEQKSKIRDKIEKEDRSKLSLFDGYCANLKYDTTGKVAEELWNNFEHYFTIGETAEYKNAQIRSTNFFQLKGLNVFAIPCIKNDEKTKPDSEWIPTLIKCAKEIAKNDKCDNKDTNEEKIDLRLVLHDKDVKGYDEEDYYIVINNDDEYHKLVGEEANDISCKIVFFKHTVNSFAKLLKRPYRDDRNIFKEIDDAIRNYQEIEPIKEEYNKVLESKEKYLEQYEELDRRLRNQINKIEDCK